MDHEATKAFPMKLPVRMVVFSHLSDAQELARLGGNPQNQINRVNFAKHLLSKYYDTSIEINPDKEYQDFIDRNPNMKF
jgi:hypothetical protein